MGEMESDKRSAVRRTMPLTGPCGRVDGFSDPAVSDSVAWHGHVDSSSSVCNRVGGFPTEPAGVWSFG